MSSATVSTERSSTSSTHDVVSYERRSSERDDGETRDSDFMLLKYRADLCYSTRDFRRAAALFESVLELLPPLNAMVKREVTDSLARCYSQLGEHQRAKKRAEQLVRLSPMSLALSTGKICIIYNIIMSVRC